MVLFLGFIDAPSSLSTPLGKVEYAFEASDGGPLSFSVFAKCKHKQQNSWFLSTDSTLGPILVSFPVSNTFQWFTIPDPVVDDANAGDVVLVDLGGRELNCEISSVMLSTVNGSPKPDLWECDSSFVGGLGDICAVCTILCGSEASVTINSNSGGCNCIFAGAGNDVVVAVGGDTGTGYICMH